MSQTHTQRYMQRLRDRAWYTAGRLIDWTCPTCGATGLDMADKCKAPLEQPCAGFVRTEEVHAEFERNWARLTAGDA